jgi:ribosome-binding protein aMBF1 (putative translation factor)
MGIKEIKKKEESLKFDLNERIKKAMLTNNLSLVDIASTILKTTMSVRNKLNGRTSWNYEELALIQKELGIKIVW